MSLVRLRTFIEVYRQRSITSAARILNLTQPAVSQHIAGLEVAVGRRLFERQATGVSPTAAADELAADLGNRLDEAEAALSSARLRSVELSGALHIIGHGDFLAEVVSPRLISLLESGMRVRLQSGDTELIQNMLIEGHCDLGIAAFPVTDKRLHCERVRQERALAVAAPVVAQAMITGEGWPQSLNQFPLLAYNLDLPVVDRWMVRNQLQPGQILPAVVGQDLRALRTLLCQGFGWSVLPEYLCREAMTNGQLVELPAPVGDITMSYYLVWTPAALRQPRIAHARQTLLWQLKEGTAKP